MQRTLKLLFFTFILSQGVFAQNIEHSTDSTAVFTPPMEMEDFNHIESISFDNDPMMDESFGADTLARKKDKKVAIAGMPTMSYDRSQGFGVGAMGMALFSLDSTKKSPLSRAMVIGNYSTIGSWYTLGFVQAYLKEDKWRLIAGAGYMSYEFQTFLFDPSSGVVTETPYNTKGYFAIAVASRKVWKSLYLGAGAMVFHANITFDDEPKVPNELNALAFTAKYDTRDNIYSTTKGWYFDVRGTYFPIWFSNSQEFGKLAVMVNQYTKINDKMLLANRLCIKTALGNDVPFTMQDVIGQSDLRGYTQGQYRGEQTYAIQSEFRYNFYKKWGLVAFFGVAEAYSHTTEPLEGHWFASNGSGTWSKLLPAGGAGLRFQMIEKEGNKINAGIDGAVGRGDWGIYFRITEAF